MKKVGLKKTSNFDAFIYLLIIGNILAMILESHISIKNKFGYYFNVFELISIIIFTFEYFYRIYLGYLDKKWKGISGYVFSFFGIIDLISILGNSVIEITYSRSLSSPNVFRSIFG